MSENDTLEVMPRERAGKGAARAARRDGLIPAVIYGEKKPPVTINLKDNELRRKLSKSGFYTHLYDLSVQGKKERVLVRAVQFDPVTDFPIHVDFLRIGRDTMVTVQVPVHFKNEAAAPGLKEGGMLNIVRHDLALVCPADSIPDEVVIDLTGLELGDSVHISMVSLPEGVHSEITDRDFTIATIAAPSAIRAEAQEAQEAEGEEEAEREDEEPADEEESESKGEG